MNMTGCFSFSLEENLSTQAWQEITDEAHGRAKQQWEDARRNENASFSFGEKGRSRSVEQRKLHAIIGCAAEKLVADFTNTQWTKQRRQYADNRQPDLIVNYKGRLVNSEVRGTQSSVGFIVRPRWESGALRDFTESKKDYLLFGVSNLPDGDSCKIGYRFFGELAPLCEKHPEWLCKKNSKTPYYLVPVDYFEFKFEDFKYY